MKILDWLFYPLALLGLSAAMALLVIVVFFALVATNLAGACPECVHTYEWAESTTTPGHFALFEDGRQIGYFAEVYRNMAGDVVDPPVALPARATRNFGIDPARIAVVPRITFQGRTIDRKEALKLIKEGVPDDTKKPRLTVIGKETARKPVLDDLAANPVLAPYRDLFVVQGYDPADPLLDCGFVKTGAPTVYVQQPDGKVLYRADIYEGPIKLAAALRRADPNYQPQKDPNSSTPLLPGLPAAPLALYALAGLGLTLAVFGGPRP